ncbi:2-oxo-tetronate isomerase [Dongia rigui]|uniref:2-oxo-tetronate isomerase n=1 Tax=Dongia rigui TaxID=940149 RepID=A0ABU5E2D1_9PROT|nr:2-oxo-tetronate isomerase [Dongia rigui]MDY0873767.1 2-oxo-tetronate isomerase [Dongia rigui]
MPRLAANLSMMFHEWPFLERFKAAKEAGFTAVEYLFPYEHPAEAMGAALQDNDLTQALFNLPPGDWAAGERGLATQPARRDEFRTGVATALRYAAATGVKRLHVMSGHGASDDKAARAAYADALRFACDQAGPAGIEILIEPINGRDMPGYFMNDFDLAVDLITELGLPNLKLQFDIYHRQIIRGDVLTGLKTLLPLIAHVQIASVPARAEPGSGELDDIRVLQELDALGYTGFVGCEYRPAAGTLAGLAWREKL